MNILITGASHPFAAQAIAALQGQHNLRLVDGDLRDLDYVGATVRGAEVVIHVAPLTRPFVNDQDNLDHAVRGTFQLMQAAHEAGVRHVVAASSLALFDCFSPSMRVASSWRPRPQPRLSDLCAYSAELLTREAVRIGTLRATCIRLGEVRNERMNWEDLLTGPQPENWTVVHYGKRPAPKIMLAQANLPARAIKKVLLLGAGGPIGASTVRTMQDSFVLRLGEIKPYDELVATAQPQSPGAPLPFMPSPPHETQVVDVTNADDVMRACEGMDAIVNLTVMRHDKVQAWRVNAIGAWNVMQAALAHGIRRVVHTGPWQIGRTDGAGYHWDYEVVDDVPPRPGGPKFGMYLASKLIGQEIVRVFAEFYGFSVPSLLFCGFVSPNMPLTEYMGRDLWPFSCSWMDTARAIKAAVQVELLPSPYEVMHINADLPHGVYPNAKAKRLLNWRPQDDLSKFYTVT